MRVLCIKNTTVEELNKYGIPLWVETPQEGETYTVIDSVISDHGEPCYYLAELQQSFLDEDNTLCDVVYEVEKFIPLSNIEERKLEEVESEAQFQ